MKHEHNPVGVDTIEILARGVLIMEDHVLLCRNVEGGYRYLPGGHVEPGESAAAALAREFMEESGVAVRVGGLLLISEHGFVQKGRPRHEIDLVFHVEHPPTLDPSRAWPSLEPDIAFDWVALSDLGAADLRPASISDWLIRLAKGGNIGDTGASGGAGGGCGWFSDMGG
jgi:8-oxo-dGTP pyrophosphatase MutT (NUDIX family)